MTDQTSTTNTQEDAIIKGLNKSAQLLKNTITTVQIEDVAVTITAEPIVVNISIPQNTDLTTLPDKLKRCLNEAFQKSIEKVLEQAAKEM